MTYAPIAIFVYARAEHTKRLFESLEKNPEYLRSPVYVFCDSPKKAEHAAAVEATRDIVKKHAPKHAQLIFREKNMGLAGSLVAGITQLTDEYGRVIVLEDDLVLSPTCLRFLNQALDHYENDDQVMHISAYMFPVTKALPELFFYSEVTCWGWATWKRAWRHFEPDSAMLVEKVNSSGLRSQFDNEGTMGFYQMLKDHSEGKNDSWAIRWYASVFFRKGLCLHPGRSLVRNEGFDGSGVHCGATDQFEVPLHSDVFTDFPRELRLSSAASEAMRIYRSTPEYNVEPPTGLRYVWGHSKHLVKKGLGLSK